VVQHYRRLVPETQCLWHHCSSEHSWHTPCDHLYCVHTMPKNLQQHTQAVNMLQSAVKATNAITRTYISRTNVYPHMPILCPQAAQFHKRRISSMTFTSAHLYGNVYMRWMWPAHSQIRLISGFWGSKVHKNGRLPASDTDEPPCKIRRHKQQSFILSWEIRNRTNTQRVNDIPTPCLLACVDKNLMHR